MSDLSRRQILQILGFGSAAGLAMRPFRALASQEASLTTRLTQEYDLQYPIVGAGVGFYALPDLVAAISNAGGLGVLGAAPEGPERMQLLIQQTKARTTRPFGVDLVNTTLFGMGIPAIVDDHINVCVEEQIPLVVFFWNTPERRWVDQLHAAGARVWMQVGTVAGATAALAVGVDGLIAQGAEAGGHHRGVEEGNATPRDRLVEQLLPLAGDRIVLGAGGIADGESLAETLLAGADGAWVGTRFCASVESYAHDDYKRRVVEAGKHDVVTTTMFGPEWPGAPMNVIRNRVVDEWAGREDEIPPVPPPPAIIGNTLFGGMPYPMPKFSVMLPTRDTTGDFEEMCHPAGGKSARKVRSILTAAEIIQDMAAGARDVLLAGW